MMTHNLDAYHLRHCLKNPLRLSRNPRLLVNDNLLRLRSYISYCYNRFWCAVRRREHAIYGEYTSFGDRPELGGMVLPTYFMRRDAQVKQLMEHGFSEVEVFDQKGNAVESGRTTKDVFLYYLARKKRK